MLRRQITAASPQRTTRQPSPGPRNYANGSGGTGKRRRLNPTPLKHERTEIQFVESGSYLLNRVLGGDGWACRRVANIVGDSATGKTLIAVEACANFVPLVRNPSDIRYIETESAFDDAYGRQIGMPPDISVVDNLTTIEGVFSDLDKFVSERRGQTTPSLYVVDSLDALSDADEMERDMGQGTFGVAKAKRMSELFRRAVEKISAANCTLIIVSQLRDKIGITFGERHTRSGGRALNFYSSQTIWLSEVGKIERQVSGAKRAVGTHVRIKNKKCKVGPAFRDADVTLWFNYGIDDEGSMLDWLAKHKASDGVNLDDIYKQLTTARRDQNREWVKEINNLLRDMVADHWDKIDAQLMPPLRKYA